MDPGFLNRLEREAGLAGLLDVLAAKLAPTDLQSLLLETYRRRASRAAPGDVARRYAESRFLRPSPVDPARLRRFDELAFRQAAEFEAIELSPVAPLGTCSAVAAVSQNLVVSTSRNNEVCSDPTNVMALECAERRRAALGREPGSAERVRLCTSHRVIRAQHFGDAPNAWPHFRLFAVCTAGRDAGGFRFEGEALREQAALHVGVLAAARDAGFEVGDVLLRVTPLDERSRAALAEKVLAPLRASFPELDADFDDERASGRGYYATACFQVNVRGEDGAELFLADGGFTDWTQRLLGDRRERLLISGFGTERFCQVCG